MDKDKKWDRKEVVVEWMFISMARERIMESMHMVGVELRKKPEKMLTNIGGKIIYPSNPDRNELKRNL